MHIKVHLVPQYRKLLQQLPQLFQRVKKHDPSASIEIIRLDKPDIALVVHRLHQVIFAAHNVLVFVAFFALVDKSVDFLKLFHGIDLF